MTAPVSELIELLSLERLEDNLFRGQSRDIGTKYVFGGQVLGQALSAAQATMDIGDPRGARFVGGAHRRLAGRERLAEHLAAEHVFRPDVAALAAEQVVLEAFERQQFDEFGDGGGHAVGSGGTKSSIASGLRSFGAGRVDDAGRVRP